MRSRKKGGKRNAQRLSTSALNQSVGKSRTQSLHLRIKKLNHINKFRPEELKRKRPRNTERGETIGDLGTAKRMSQGTRPQAWFHTPCSSLTTPLPEEIQGCLPSGPLCVCVCVRMHTCVLVCKRKRQKVIGRAGKE